MAAAEARGELADAGPAGPSRSCVYVGPSVDAERLRGRSRGLDRRVDSPELAPPDVRERDSERGRLGDDAVGHRQRHEPPADRERVHRHLRPVDELLDAARARRARRRAQSRTRRRAPPALAHDREPFCPCRSGGLTTNGYPIRSAAARASTSVGTTAYRGCGTPASASRWRWRSFEVASTAASGDERVRQPEPRGDPRRDRDREVDPGRDHAVEPLGRGEPLDSELVLGRDDRPPVGEAEPGRRRDRGRPRS